jgi:hypothetical protein
VDEAGGRPVLEGVALLVGREPVVVERDRGAPADDLRVALVEAHARLAADRRLRRVDESFKLAARTIYFDQATLGVQNLAVYL